MSNAKGNTLIVDAGATKTHWALIASGDVLRRHESAGINALTLPGDALRPEIEMAREALGSCLPARIRFYGAGLALPPVCRRMEEALADVFLCGDVEARSDMLGAARGLVGKSRGVVAILGTGSNACLCDGGEIIDSIPSMGYVLGDDGGGVGIGRRFLRALFKRRLPAECVGEAGKAGFTLESTLQGVYSSSRPNAFIASAMPLVKRLLTVPEVERLVVEEFRAFIEMNVRSLARGVPVSFCGSVAVEFRPQLEKAAAAEGITISRVERSPLEGLAEYHAND